MTVCWVIRELGFADAHVMLTHQHDLVLMAHYHMLDVPLCTSVNSSIPLDKSERVLQYEQQRIRSTLISSLSNYVLMLQLQQLRGVGALAAEALQGPNHTLNAQISKQPLGREFGHAVEWSS